MSQSAGESISKWDLKEDSHSGNARELGWGGNSGGRHWTKHDVKQPYTEHFQKKGDHEENDNNVRSAVQWGGRGSHKMSHPQEDARWRKRTPSPAAGDTKPRVSWGAIESRDMPPSQKDAQWRKQTPSSQGDTSGLSSGNDDLKWRWSSPPQAVNWGMSSGNEDWKWPRRTTSPQADTWGFFLGQDKQKWCRRSPPQGDTWGLSGQEDPKWCRRTPSPQANTWGLSSGKEDPKWRRSTPSPQADNWGLSSGQEDPKWRRRTPSPQTDTWGLSFGQEDPKWRKHTPSPQADTWGFSSGCENRRWRGRTPSLRHWSPRKRSRSKCHRPNRRQSRRELEYYGRSKRSSELPGNDSQVKHFRPRKSRNVSSRIAYHQGHGGERYREKKTNWGKRDRAFEQDNDRVVNSGNGRELQLGSEETDSNLGFPKPKYRDELPGMAAKLSVRNFNAQSSSQLMVDEPKLDEENFHSRVLPGNNVVSGEDFSPIRNLEANLAHLFGQRRPEAAAFGCDSSAEPVPPVPNVAKQSDLPSDSTQLKQPKMSNHPPRFPTKPDNFGCSAAVGCVNESTEAQNLGHQPEEEKMGGDKLAENSGPLENGGVGKAEDEEKMTQMKKLRPFKAALVGEIKDMLKPLWKEGKIEKVAHNNIVKKVVDKVTGSLHEANIPQTNEKINRYLLASKPKLTKLVQAYVEKLSKTGQ